MIGDCHFDACVDSGATTLMLKQVYDPISNEQVGPCEETSVILMGESSKNYPYLLALGYGSVN